LLHKITAPIVLLADDPLGIGRSTKISMTADTKTVSICQVMAVEYVCQLFASMLLENE
jgi:hypothetical protein